MADRVGSSPRHRSSRLLRLPMTGLRRRRLRWHHRWPCPRVTPRELQRRRHRLPVWLRTLWWPATLGLLVGGVLRVPLHGEMLQLQLNMAPANEGGKTGNGAVNGMRMDGRAMTGSPDRRLHRPSTRVTLTTRPVGLAGHIVDYGYKLSSAGIRPRTSQCTSVRTESFAASAGSSSRSLNMCRKVSLALPLTWR